MPTKQAAVTAAISAFIIATFFGVIIYLKTPERTREIIETTIFILMISFGFIFRVLGEPTPLTKDHTPNRRLSGSPSVLATNGLGRP